MPWRGRAAAALRDRRGVTTLEFGAMGTVLLMLVMSVIELSVQVATSAALDWSAGRASRFGITGSSTVSGTPAGMPSCRSQIIPWLVTYSTAGFLAADKLSLETTAYADGAPGTPGVTGVPGPGQPGDVVAYQLTYHRPFLTPLTVMLLGQTEVVHQAYVLVRNEMFENATC